MPRALIAKLRPNGPWRVGPSTGDRLRVDRVLHSDALYSAITLALIELGQGDEWLAATATQARGSDVRLSSCFPFVDDVLFLAPPDTHWPPPASLRIRWKGARYVPASAVAQLLIDKPLLEEHYVVDGVSECLLPVIRNVAAPSPFRVAVRSRAAVDRLGSGVEPHRTACVEFAKGAGIWMAFTFADATAASRWAPAIQGALRLIADSGLGGERSSGWGRFEQPDFVEGDLAQILFAGRYRAPQEVDGQWLLSLFSPAADETVDWRRGTYRVITRTGRVERAGVEKRANNMIAEGGVLVAPEPLRGMARDVAPEGFPHPVYRAGFALAIPIGKAKPKPLPDVKRMPVPENKPSVEEPIVPEPIVVQEPPLKEPEDPITEPPHPVEDPAIVEPIVEPEPPAREPEDPIGEPAEPERLPIEEPGIIDPIVEPLPPGDGEGR
jgi:CRISPR type III-A-associated RAMP protein Csm4